MSHEHDDEFLAGLVGGDLDPREPGTAARLARDPELAARWDELRAFADDLDTEGRARREFRREPTTAEIEFAQRVLGSQRRTGHAQRPGRRVWMLLAASLVAIASIWAWNTRTDPRSDAGRDYGLSVTELRLLAPDGEWRAGEPLRWQYTPLPAGASFLVGIEDAATHTPVLPERKHFSSSWTPNAEEFAQLPPEIVVRIEAVSVQGEPLGSRRFSLSVSR